MRTLSAVCYVEWQTADGSAKYYTADGGLTFIGSLGKPYEITLRQADPADQLIIATLTQSIDYVNSDITCAVYEDRANGNKRYYSWDNGQSYFDDIANPHGSLRDMSDAANAGLDASFQKVDSTITVSTNFVRYRDPVAGFSYYSADGGATFYIRPYTQKLEDATIIGRLVLGPKHMLSTYEYEAYLDPITNIRYYAVDPSKMAFVSNLNDPWNITLDYANNPDIIDRLEPITATSAGFVRTPLPDEYEVYEIPNRSTKYYTYDGGKTFVTNPFNPYADSYKLDPVNDSATLAQLQPMMTMGTKVEYIEQIVPGYTITTTGGISTQAAAQQALAAIDRAIVSKDKIRANLGATQNRLENTVTNLTLMSENLLSAESRISDADIGVEMMLFVRNQILTQSAVAMPSQANSFPHMLMNLIG